MQFWPNQDLLSSYYVKIAMQMILNDKEMNKAQLLPSRCSNARDTLAMNYNIT